MSLHTFTALQDLLPWIGAVMVLVGLVARSGEHPEDSGFFVVAGLIVLVLSGLLYLTEGRI